MLPEDISVGAVVEQVKATDADFGINQEVSYRIKKGKKWNYIICSTATQSFTLFVSLPTRFQCKLSIYSETHLVCTLRLGIVLKIRFSHLIFNISKTNVHIKYTWITPSSLLRLLPLTPKYKAWMSSEHLLYCYLCCYPCCTWLYLQVPMTTLQ